MVQIISLAVVLTAATVVVSSTIRKRQSAIPGIPSSCVSVCNSVTSQVTQCELNAGSDIAAITTCICTANFQQQVIPCITCVDTSVGGAEAAQEVQASLNAFCNGGLSGLPSIAASGGLGSSSTIASNPAASSIAGILSSAVPIPSAVSSAVPIPSAVSSATIGAGVTTPVNTPSVTFTQTFPTAAPAANQKNVSIGVSDSRITYNGADWQTKPSSDCNSGPVRTNNVTGESLTFSFTGSAVYMATAENSGSGVYSVAVDGQSAVAVDGFVNSKTSTCSYAWSAPSLSDGPHSVVVQLVGQSSKAAANGVAAGTGFELDGFTITTTVTSGVGKRVTFGYGIPIAVVLSTFSVLIF